MAQEPFHFAVSLRPSLRWLFGILLSALALGALAGAASGLAVVGLQRSREAAPLAPAFRFVEASTVSPGTTVTEDSAIVAAFQRVSPATVTIVTSLRNRGLSGRGATASGSGVLLDQRGYIVTNNHVVKGAQSLLVVLADGAEHQARLVGSDEPFTDLAVLKIEGKEFPYVELASSDSLAIGQRVLAIGNPLGEFSTSVTSGIISGLERAWSRGGVRMEGLVQTDAAVNQGNSGGPLVDLNGRVVGLTTSVIRNTEGGEPVEGLGFAIPSDVVRSVATQIVQEGRVRRPYLGIGHEPITPAMTSYYALPVSQGIVVVSVEPNSGAERGGLRQGDIITAIDDHPLDTEHDLISVLAYYQPGNHALFRVHRDTQRLALEVVFSERKCPPSCP